MGQDQAMEMPEVRFVRTRDGVTIAYNVWGSGETNIVLLSIVPHSIDWRWSQPSIRQFLEYMTDLGTNALLDFRGCGASDVVPTEQLGDIDGWVSDVLAVMDDCDMDSAILFCSGPPCHVGLQLAASAPERVDGLWLADGMLRLDPGLVDFISRYVEKHWGTGRVSDASGTDYVSIEESARLERWSAARNTAAALVRRSFAFDATELAAQVSVPTMIAYTGALSWVTRDDCQALQQAVPDSSFVDVSGASHLYRPVSTEALEAFERFMVGHVLERATHAVASIIFTDLVGSTSRAAASGDVSWSQQLDQLSREVEDRVAGHDGEVIKDTGDGHLILAASVIDAARLALGLVDVARQMGLELRVGVHTGPVVRRGSDVAGISVNTAARIMSLAGPGQVWVSRTVVDLLAGTGVNHEDRGIHTLKGIGGEWQLCELTKPPS